VAATFDRRRTLATLATWATWATWAAGVGAAGTLPGCGGGSNGSSTGSTRLRALNLTSDLPSIDLLTDDTNRYAALAADAMSDYQTFDAATVALKVRRAGDATQLYSSSYVLAKDEVYTAVVWGRETSLRVHTLPEDAVDTDIADGAARLRVFNATIDAGALDVYVTSATADIGESAALQSALAGGTLGSYRDLSAGTFRLRVTGAGDPADLRLDVPAIALSIRKHATLVITAGASGVLVNGVLIPLQGTASVMKNTQARVRVVAGVAGSGNVAVTVGGQVVAGGYRSPTVGPYTRVAAGTVDVVVRLDGGAPIHHLARHPRGPHQPLETQRFHARQALLADGGHVGQVGVASRAGDGQPRQGAAGARRGGARPADALGRLPARGHRSRRGRRLDARDAGQQFGRPRGRHSRLGGAAGVQRRQRQPADGLGVHGVRAGRQHGADRGDPQGALRRWRAANK
jgi:hypothetical protein